ncbi:type II toxin-antitoxin system RelE/ParE family toxin [Deinococcus soli (ex Cha et al. 2016)]|uniref:Phage-related protein n=2 Tax=Deinococcus soli (ex Cha et al. 2016) TaxID=1309411 RepID=A0AAE3XHL4_9DEIO|nr:type II toxin-antitoxin system RelE/ParE family toxin [Deinococcus soli (ex Cha et al. 2016)]MDR6221516.1 phage-related protein [Deinococcus soli (ex Cha et al. 2016)]MDR6331498.1 phage-related protein [Deinococcus soli (ex Cha et al. 2016)]MDR6754665.1 phage-related protein [Deinococcus soli (ex Cha et al. 2016)]
MSFRLHLARLPDRLDTPRPLLIDDFLAMAHAGKQTCLRAVVEMCADLHENGMASRYIKHLGGPLYELKKRASDGGARVYFFRYGQDFVLVHAECKTQDQADQHLLYEALNVIEALEGHQPVLETRR